MSRFNLSEWALAHRSLVLYAMVVLALFGIVSYTKLGQSEDPPFTFKVMVIRTGWPGATARQVEEQITDKIEKKLQEAPNIDVIQSYSKPGESFVFFRMKDSAPTSAVPDTWYQVRKKIGDIRSTLPAGITGPSFNDEFGDVFGNIYALTGEGFSYADLKKYADRVRAELLRVPEVAKVEFFGEQEEKVFIELSNTKLATLGVDVPTIVNALATQNAIAPAGAFETPSDKIFLRTTGDFDSAEAIRETTIRANGRLFRIGDIARVQRGYADPPQPKMRFQGREAFGIGVAMVAGGDIIELGHNLDREVARIRKELPVGLELAQVTSQPQAVQRSVNEFVRSLAEAVIIVLAVSLLSLGLRTGIVVALTIPLVLAATFLFMRLGDIGLHKISLGALILSLGLLVDDAIIAVEMMATKMEQGWDRLRAASFTYTSTAMPMLSGTLVTVAGFLPIATAASSTGEYTRSIFQVTAIALAVSWVAAVVFVPYLGYKLLPDLAHRETKPSWLQRLLRRLLRRPAPGARRSRRARRRRDLPDAVLPQAAARDPLVRRAPHDGAGRDRRALRGVAARVPLRAAAVLPGVQPAGDPGRPATPARLVVRRNRERGQAVRDRPRAGEGGRELHELRRPGHPALLSAARPAARPRRLRAVRDPDQGHQGTRGAARAADRALRARLPGPAREHHAARERPAGRLPGAVPGVRRGHPDGAAVRRARRREDAREPERLERPVRLGREGEGDQGRHRPGEGAPARALLAGSLHVPQHLAQRPHGHLLPRARQADRGADARRDRRAREALLSAGPRGADTLGPGGREGVPRLLQVGAA